MPGQVHCEVEHHVGWIVFDHPERRNVLSANMWAELSEAARRHQADDEVRVVVMRGAGDTAFVSGADISQYEGSGGGEVQGGLVRGGGNAFNDLAALDKPLIAMIHGWCIGGGLAIALMADMRYADEGARFGIPAARLGVGYDLGGIEALADEVALAACFESEDFAEGVEAFLQKRAPRFKGR